jgi:phosphatidylserine/phosphatidylglycerophosphate/cardiolipin synthase-like enzyme
LDTCRSYPLNMKPTPPDDFEGSRTELVLTLPDSLEVDAGANFLARSTLGVLVELLSTAQEHVLMGAPFVEEKGALLEGPVGTALDSALDREVGVDLVTTDQTLHHEPFVKLRSKHPDSFRVYRPAEKDGRYPPFFSHAKFCIADRRAAYVGSANFTHKGIQGNLEMGILIHGPIVQGMAKFFEFLFEKRYLVEVLE